MSSQSNDRRSSKAGVIVAIVFALLLLPVLYVASIGPLVGHGRSSGLNHGDNALLDAYLYPVNVLYDVGYADWLDRYINWWSMPTS